MSIEELTPEHRVVAERARHYIMTCIAGLAVASEVEKPMPDIGLDDEVVS